MTDPDGLQVSLPERTISCYVYRTANERRLQEKQIVIFYRNVLITIFSKSAQLPFTICFLAKVGLITTAAPLCFLLNSEIRNSIYLICRGYN